MQIEICFLQPLLRVVFETGGRNKTLPLVGNYCDTAVSEQPIISTTSLEGWSHGRLLQARINTNDGTLARHGIEFD